MKKKTIIICTILFVVIQIWFITIVCKYPYYGIVANQDADGSWTITSIDPSSQLHLDNVKIGDTVLKIDGRPPSMHNTVRHWGVIEQFHTLILTRDGRTITIYTDKLPKVGAIDIQSFAGTFVALLISFFVYMKIGSTKSARLLALVFVTIAVTFMCLSVTGRANILAVYLIAISLAFIPMVFLQFLIAFFSEKANIGLPKIPIKSMYLVPILFGIYSLLDFFHYPYLGAKNQLRSQISILCFILGVFFIFSLLINVYIRYRKEKSYEATLIKTIWITLGISFAPVIFLSLLPSIIMKNSIGFVNPIYTGWFILFFPASFAYLIASKQLYDLHLVLRRVCVSFLISLFPSLVLIFLLKTLDIDTNFKDLFAFFISMSTIFTIVLYLIEYLTNKLEPFMFPRKHYLQLSLKKIARNLSNVSSFQELKNIILVDIIGTLGVYGGAIVFKYTNRLEIINVGLINEDEVRSIIEAGLLEHINYSVFEINKHEDYASFLIMSRKKTNTLLGIEETQWLNLIITYLAVSLENIHLIGKLTTRLQQFVSKMPNIEMANEINWFRKLLFQLQEKERVRIATDLHDTTIQDLYFLKRRLMDVFDHYSLHSEDQQKINNILEYIEIMNTNLRNSCFELNPYLLKETGLVETVQKLIDHEKMLSDFTIDYFPISPDKIELLSLDNKHHIFRIIQELINNAKKHSQARTLFLELNVNQDQFELQYEDDGVGFDSTQMESQEIGGHGIGMEQMRTRVYSLNGSFLLETAPGKGVRIFITFPLKEGRVA